MPPLYGYKIELFVINGYFAVYTAVERNEGLCAVDTVYSLYTVIQQLHKMLVVTGIQLDKHSVRTGSEMTFNNFGYLFKLRHYVAIHGAAVKINTYVSTRAITEHFGIDMVTRTRDDLKVDHALQTLVYGGARHSALHSLSLIHI